MCRWRRKIRCCRLTACGSMRSHRRPCPCLRRRPGRADADENAGSRPEHDRPFHLAAPRRYEALFSVKDRRSYLVGFDAATQKNEDRIVNSVSGTHNASSPVYPMKGTGSSCTHRAPGPGHPAPACGDPDGGSAAQRWRGGATPRSPRSIAGAHTYSNIRFICPLHPRWRAGSTADTRPDAHRDRCEGRSQSF